MGRRVARASRPYLRKQKRRAGRPSHSFDNPVLHRNLSGSFEDDDEHEDEDDFCRGKNLQAKRSGNPGPRKFVLQAKAQERFVYSANRGALKCAAQS
jgi:hypothetical protein